MKYKKYNNSGKPLREKFDNTDFPFDASAWSQMETLLSSESKGKKKGRFTSAKRIIGLFLLSVGLFWGGYEWGRKKEVLLINQSPTQFHKREGFDAKFTQQSAQSTPSVFEAENALFDDINLDKKVKNAQKSVSIFNFKNDPSRLWFDNKALENSYLPHYLSNLFPFYWAKSAASFSKKSGEKIENNTAKSGGNLKNSTKNGQKNSQKDAQKDNKSDTSKTTRTNKKIDFAAIQPDKMQDFLKNDKANSLDALVKNNTTDVRDTLSKNIDEEAFLRIVRVPIVAVEPLPILEATDSLASVELFDFDKFGWAFASLKPIKPTLWHGKKHQIYVGVGLFKDVDKGYNLKYVRRITPLFGLGGSFFNGNSYDERINSLDLDAQFYLFSRRRFEVNLTAGYGYAWGEAGSLNSHITKVSAFRFSGGLETRFCFNQNWNLGVRADLRNQMGAIMIQLGLRF